jgi:integrase
VTRKLGEGLSPKTISNHLALRRRMFRVAVRWRLVRSNPVEMIDPPKATDDADPEVLTEVEIARVLSAYRERETDADDEEQRVWWALARRVFTVAVGTGLRRGELLGLHWGDVSMLDRRLSVRQAWVRGEMTTPKSRTSRRVLDLEERGHVLAALEEQYEASRYRTDDSLVFCHPALGTPLDPTKLTRNYMRPALRAAKITKSFRAWHGLRHTALTTSGREPAGVRADARGPLERLDHRALHPRGAGRVPRCGERAENRIFSALEEAVPKAVPNALSPRRGRGRRNGLCAGSFSAPGVGFEPTALRLTAGCSTVELPRTDRSPSIREGFGTREPCVNLRVAVGAQ